MRTELDLINRKILNIIQSSFPLVDEPFRDVGEALDINESDVIRRIGEMKDQNVVRQISAIFDTRKLGYKTVLVAMRLAPDELDAGAQRINEHPGVSHNYARVGDFNLWFTLAVGPEESLEDTVSAMARDTNAQAYRLMPTIKFFKIGVNFDMIKEEGAANEYYSPDGFDGGDANGWNKVEPVTPFEIEAIRELQEDILLEPRPFHSQAQRLGITVDDLFDLAADFIDRGIMRRYSAVPSERSIDVGNIMAQSKWVTHCYERPTFPDWKYTHFTMIHATSKQACEQAASDISMATGIDDYKALYSIREYKKTRVKYFV